MGKQISKETQEQIPILYKKLKTKTKVAQELGVSVSTVTKYLTLFEAATISEEPRKKAKTKITPEMVEKINALYKDYKNMSQVARELNISPSTVKKYLSKDNLKLIKEDINDRDALFYYIYKLFGQFSEDKPVNPHNISQMQKFKREGMPYKGQLLTLKYFYEVEKHTIDKANGSIGIIPYVYSNAESYYRSQAKRSEEISKAIQKQLEQDRIEIKYNPNDYFTKNRKKKKLIDLDSLGE